MNNDAMQDDPATIYAQLSPEQRAAIAQQFIDGFRQSGTPAEQPFTSMSPQTVTAEQLAAMHRHAGEEQKGLFARVMRHPIATIALGDFATYEIEHYVNS